MVSYFCSCASAPLINKEELLHANPKLVLDFYNQQRHKLLQAKPNDGHIGLAQLEKDFDVQIITQNIDNLHERAGSTHDSKLNNI